MTATPRSLDLAARVSAELLPDVRQPAQYIGGEVNQLVHPGQWQAAKVKVAVAFPDTYTIGMSHLGCQILYWLCNHTPGVCAERVFAPWLDAERVMRQRGLPLFTWDTRQPVQSADILGISLQYELCFTTVLNLLDLAGIPLRAEERANTKRPDGEDWPLVVAGGPQADNPEPMAEFLDIVIVGDGEESMAALLAAYQEYQQAGVRRNEMIALLAQRFSWVYAPNLYDASYHEDGTFAGLIPKLAGLPATIERCRTRDFEAAPFPRKPLVPWLEVVHDRIGIEIMRGCPQVCRFCHAGYTKRPLTYRSVEQVVAMAEEAYLATGHHEIGLLSLSTADYPLLPELARRLNERFASRHVNLSFPSLRIDKMLQHIPWMANSVRKGSITMAVEAARDDMRRAIRKKVTDGNLLDGVREVYKAGWNRVKLYFMSGFPGEQREDLEGIWRLSNEVSLERCKLGKPAADVNAAVGWLVPKPFTPLQWMAQPRVEYFQEMRTLLQSLSKPHRGGESRPQAVDGGLGGYGSVAGMMDDAPAFDVKHRAGRWKGKKSRVRITTHDPRRSVLEGVFARGDRRLAAVVHEAWKRGARLDAWDEAYRHEHWTEAFAATGIDPAFYAHRERPFSERLPWEHIGLHMSRSFLEKSYDDLREQVSGSRQLPVMQAT